MAVRQTPSLIVSEIVKCRCSRVCVCVRFDLESTLLGLVVPVTTLCNVVDHLSCNLQIEPKGQDQVNWLPVYLFIVSADRASCDRLHYAECANCSEKV